MSAGGRSAVLQRNLLLQYKSTGALRRFSRMFCGKQRLLPLLLLFIIIFFGGSVKMDYSHIMVDYI